MISTEVQQLITTLKKYFGYDSFRPHQEEIITNVLSGKDGLVIMPTGGGKSICFQLPAIILPKTTIVISPLIALMKDQVDGLKAIGISAAYFNSSQDAATQNQIIDDVVYQRIKLLYVAPESLPSLNNIIDADYISCVAIDEAHCISSWGHDFRPAYQQLAHLKTKLNKTPFIALTATADKATRQDILDQLAIPNAQQYITSFDRANITLEVRPSNKRIEQIEKFINKRPTESGIIYCLSRKSTEELSKKLKAKGVLAAAYHAGLSFEERSKIQEDFVYDKVPIVCATIAFGMGIDKSNVRWVIHYNLPKNIEGYYQEIGRAGRDGVAAHALLFQSYADVIQLRRFAEDSSNEEFQIAKLNRMKEFAEATSCRRRILLSYFGEIIENDCGNCDVCKNPPKFFDGTIIAQKALSVMARLKESEAMNMVIDVLRGAANNMVLSKGYQNVKSYGIGRDLPSIAWQQYITQLLNLGYCEIAFHQNNALKLTELGKKVLFEGYKVHLSKAVNFTKQEIEKPKKVKTFTDKPTGDLFERLRLLRLKISMEEGIPAYRVFSDATLKELEAERPMSEEEFIEINGVGQKKLEDYSDIFIKEIIAFTQEKTKKK